MLVFVDMISSLGIFCDPPPAAAAVADDDDGGDGEGSEGMFCWTSCAKCSDGSIFYNMILVNPMPSPSKSNEKLVRTH